MSNKYFVTVSKNVNIVYKINGKLIGNRFVLKTVYDSEKLDNEGFVVDFSKTNAILDNIKETLEKGLLNDLFNSRFSFQIVLEFIVDKVQERVGSLGCNLNKVILEGVEECYEVEL